MHPIDQIRHFTAMTPELETRLRSLMRDETFAKGNVIHHSVILRKGMFYINPGAARVFYTAGGTEHTCWFAFTDQYVIIPHQLTTLHSETAAIQFLEPTSVTVLPETSIKNELEESGAVIDSEALLFINAALSQYIALLEERIDVLQTLNATERYRWAMRRFPRLSGCATATQIASFLGITKETLYRIKGGKYAGRRRATAPDADNSTTRHK